MILILYELLEFTAFNEICSDSQMAHNIRSQKCCTRPTLIWYHDGFYIFFDVEMSVDFIYVFIFDVYTDFCFN